MSAMSTEQMRTVRVRLDEVDDLFVDPEPGSDRYVSGFEEFYRVVRTLTSVFKQPDTYQVTIELPHEKITDGRAEELSAKIKRYCQFKAEEGLQNLLALRRQGWDSVRVIVFVLVPCLILGTLYLWLS